MVSKTGQATTVQTCEHLDNYLNQFDSLMATSDLDARWHLIQCSSGVRIDGAEFHEYLRTCDIITLELLLSLDEGQLTNVLRYWTVGSVKSVWLDLSKRRACRRDDSASMSSSITSLEEMKSKEWDLDFVNDLRQFTAAKSGNLATSTYRSIGRNNSNTFDIAPSLPPDRLKALIALVYVIIVSWVTAFTMVIVHDRVPDMQKYPPLPDMILDNLPTIPGAFKLCEMAGMTLMFMWTTVCLFHKHRFILCRRFFAIGGTVFLLRCITMLLTSLSVPGRHLRCSPRPYGDFHVKLNNAYIIWKGCGMTLQGVRTCGDYMFSGHTVTLTLLNFFITEYTSRRIYFLHTFTWMCNMFGIFFILASHEHYSIDVFVAFYISSRIFLYYHTFANNHISRCRVDHRSWLNFPLFHFFEANIDGKVPNVFDWPISRHKLALICNKFRPKTKST